MPQRQASKLQRWTDLIAALLRRRYPATFEELSRDVPAYSGRKRDATLRMFERDKDELRAFGISIETVAFEDDSGEASGYRLDRKGFYLPYLSLASREGKRAPAGRGSDKFGFRALASLVVEPDEMAVISDAAVRVSALGDPVLAAEADSAMRKLSFDIPLPERSKSESEIARFASSSRKPAEEIFEAFNDALSRRKRVSFDYHTMGADASARRIVEPYGLFYLNSHWYVAGRDADKNELRNFRLSRISGAEVNAARSQSTDYEIPDDFNLRDHARSKRAWELGDSSGTEAIVDFSGMTGAAKAAAKLGTAIEGSGDRRKFIVRRIDTFARWLLSFGGDAIPVAPHELVADFERQVDETRAVYGATR